MTAAGDHKLSSTWAMVMARLEERLLPILVIGGSNLVNCDDRTIMKKKDAGN